MPFEAFPMFCFSLPSPACSQNRQMSRWYCPSEVRLPYLCYFYFLDAKRNCWLQRHNVVPIKYKNKGYHIWRMCVGKFHVVGIYLVQCLARCAMRLRASSSSLSLPTSDIDMEQRPLSALYAPAGRENYMEGNLLHLQRITYDDTDLFQTPSQ